MKDFEKEFPSLSNCWINARGRIEVSSVKVHCLDKERVKEAISKCRKEVQTSYNYEYGKGTPIPEFDILEEELGL